MGTSWSCCRDPTGATSTDEEAESGKVRVAAKKGLGFRV